MDLRPFILLPTRLETRYMPRHRESSTTQSPKTLDSTSNKATEKTSSPLKTEPVEVDKAMDLERVRSVKEPPANPTSTEQQGDPFPEINNTKHNETMFKMDSETIAPETVTITLEALNAYKSHLVNMTAEIKVLQAKNVFLETSHTKLKSQNKDLETRLMSLKIDSERAEKAGKVKMDLMARESRAKENALSRKLSREIEAVEINRYKKELELKTMSRRYENAHKELEASLGLHQSKDQRIRDLTFLMDLEKSVHSRQALIKNKIQSL